MGVLPIFIGYAFLGTIMFYRSNRFGDMGISLFTLFAVMNGDMIFDTYYDLSTIHFIFSIFYIYSFIFIAICVIQNVFVILIEEGFMKSKYAGKHGWVEEH